MLATCALHALLKLKLKGFGRVAGSFELLLHFLELLNKVLEVLQSILLSTSLELWVVFAEQSLQKLGSYSVLIVFIFGIGFFRLFVCKFLLRILS